MRIHTIVVALAVFIVSSEAPAATLFFDSRAAFETLVQPDLFVTLDSFVADGPCTALSCTGVYDGELRVVGLDGNPGFHDGNMSWTTHPLSFTTFGLVDGPFSAVGFDISGSPETMVQMFQGGSLLHTFSGGSFAGLAFEGPIASLSLNVIQAGPTVLSQPLVVDNMTFRTAVPEPSTVWLLATGLAFAFCRRRFRDR